MSTDIEQIDTEKPWNENPFAYREDGHTKDFSITSEIDLARLQNEVGESLGFPVMMAMMGMVDPDTPPSAEDPATLYVHADEEFDGRKVRGAITAHDPTPAPVEQPSPEDLKARLLDGEDLDLGQALTLLRSLLTEQRP